MSTNATAPFRAENVHLICIYPFAYSILGESSPSVGSPTGIFTSPSEFAKKQIFYRRQTFLPELEWRDRSSFFSIDVKVVSVCCQNKIYNCIHSDFLLTVYPELICTLQLHVELRDPVYGASDAIELVKYLKEFTAARSSSWIRCIVNSGIVDFASFYALAEFIKEKFQAAYNLSSIHTAPTAFIFPVFYAGRLPGCATGSDIIANYKTEISGILNLWAHNYDLQSNEEVIERTRKNFHPLTYGTAFISSAGFFEFHPENTIEIARREGISVRDHHFQEIYYATALSEIAVAQYFALRVCDDVLDREFANTNISVIYILNPLLSLVRALSVLKFERHITVLLSSIRSLDLTRKPYTREIIAFLNSQFDTTKLQERVSQKVAGINRILTSMFQSIIATTSLVVAVAAAILTILQLVGDVKDKGVAKPKVDAPAVSHSVLPF